MREVAVIMSEWADLPEYCQVRLAEREMVNTEKKMPAAFVALRDKWLKRFGNNWKSFHHYCWGIKRMNQALLITEKSQENQRKETFKAALAEFRFMKNRSDRSFPLGPQLFMYESQIYLELGQPAMAYRSMQYAVQLQKRLKSRR